MIYVDKICVCTGWCSDYRGPTNKSTSKRLYDPKWLETWKAYIELFIKPDHYFIYSSNCGNKIQGMNYDNVSIVTNHTEVTKQEHYHDWYNSVIMGMQYAYCNEMNFAYIEQDCLVYGLDKALEFAKSEKIVYGFGKYSFAPNWAEQSFMYISWSVLPDVIRKVNTMAHSNELCEVIWHKTFEMYATNWGFGYGRKRPIDFNRPIFFAQQIRDNELDEFLRIGGLK